MLLEGQCWELLKYSFGIHFLKDYDKLLSLNLRLISGFQILSVLDVHMCIMSGLGVF